MILKQYNQQPSITSIRSLYETNKQFNSEFGKDKFHPITAELNLKNYTGYSRKNTIMVCKLEDVEFLVLQNHPIENIIYVADNTIRQKVAQSYYNVKTHLWDGGKSEQPMKKIIKEYETKKIDIVIFRNRATFNGDNAYYIRYKKLAYGVVKPNGICSVTSVPMAMANQTKGNHDVIAFAVGKLEKHSPDGGYVGIVYKKDSNQGVKPSVWKPIDPKNRLDNSILEKLLEPNSFDVFTQTRTLRQNLKKGSVKLGGKNDTILKLTQNSAQPFIFGESIHKNTQPKAIAIIVRKLWSANPADCIATTQKNFCDTSYTVKHKSWINFSDAQLGAAFGRDNSIVSFLKSTFGLKHRTFFHFLKEFNIKEIRLPTDYPASYQLTTKEKQHLDTQ